jgi:regulator of replication initiation timing
LLGTQGVVGIVWFVKMARITAKQLEEENKKLQAEIESLRSRLQESVNLVLGVLDNANAIVARHLTDMRLQDTDYEPTEEQ